MRLHVLLDRHVRAAGELVTPELQEQVEALRKAKTETYQAQIAAAAAQLLSGSASSAGLENVDIQDLEFQLLQYLRCSNTPKSDEAGEGASVVLSASESSPLKEFERLLNTCVERAKEGACRGDSWERVQAE